MIFIVGISLLASRTDVKYLPQEIKLSISETVFFGNSVLVFPTSSEALPLNLFHSSPYLLNFVGNYAYSRFEINPDLSPTAILG